MSQSTSLTTFASLQNDTSATTDLNNNFSAINTALTGCLSILGQAPNQMQANMDMNSNRIINLPAPVSINEPLRLADATTLNGGGTVTVSQLPIGGTVGQVLTKNSSTNFDVSWQTPSVNVTVGKVLSVTNSLTLSGTDGTVITFQGSDTYVGRATTDSFSNKTFNANINGNVLQITGVTLTGVTGTGAVCLASTPTISNPTLTGTVGGTPTFAGNNFIALNNMSQQSMFTLIGNPTTTTANLSAFTIGSLTQKASPAGTDYVLIQDNASSPVGAIKYATVATIATAGSVSSIAGNTGAFTLGLGITNATNNIILDPLYHRGVIGGLTLSNDGTNPTTTIDISQGYCADSTAAYMMKLSGNFTKLITGTWAVGSGNGGLDTGSVAASTWYHVYAIARSDTGVVDIAISTSASGPSVGTNIPAAYTVFRRIGSIRTDASAHIINFAQNGDEFMWLIPTIDVNSATSQGTAAVLRTLTVPTGVVVNAYIIGANVESGTTAHRMYVSSPTATDQVPGTGNFNLGGSDAANTQEWRQMTIRTNTSAQIRTRTEDGGATENLFINTVGWRDFRGQNV